MWRNTVHSWMYIIIISRIQDQGRRNFGTENAVRENIYLILDSDLYYLRGILLPVDEELKREPCRRFLEGPDRAHDSFSATQKAINYAMTSFFTTGGIRGGKMDRFTPSFNMGYVPMYIASWEVFSKCVSAKTSISVSGYSRLDAGCRLFS